MATGRSSCTIPSSGPTEHPSSSGPAFGRCGYQPKACVGKRRFPAEPDSLPPKLAQGSGTYVSHVPLRNASLEHRPSSPLVCSAGFAFSARFSGGYAFSDDLPTKPKLGLSFGSVAARMRLSLRAIGPGSPKHRTKTDDADKSGFYGQKPEFGTSRAPLPKRIGTFPQSLSRKLREILESRQRFRR